MPGGAPAEQSFLTAYARIDHHFEQLCNWAEYMGQARQPAAELVQSEVFLNLVIVGTAELCVNGWSSIAAARCCILEPCRSLMQVVHQSGLFKLQHKDINGSRDACFADVLRYWLAGRQDVPLQELQARPDGLLAVLTWRG